MYLNKWLYNFTLYIFNTTTTTTTTATAAAAATTTVFSFSQHYYSSDLEKNFTFHQQYSLKKCWTTQP